VISRQLWERKWQTDQTVVGGSIALDGQSFTISGVADMPEDLLPGVQVLLPLSPKASESRSAHDIDVVARLGSGITPGQAQAEMNNLAAFMDRANPRTNAGWGLQVVPLAESIVGPTTSRMVWMIFAAVALLWALACANVAGLQLARSVSRRHEMSTRLMLGASRGRLLAQTLTESFLLAATGAILGTVIAQFATAAIRTLGSQFFPRLAQLELDTTTIVVAIAVMLASTLLFGLAGRAPAYQPGREISRRDRGRDALIVAQVALASILLLGATLLFQSFLRLRAVDPGFNPESVLSVRVDLANGKDNLHRTAFFRDVTQELSRLPDVESVGASNVVPFSGSGTANRFRVDGEPASEFHSAAWRAVTPGFFVTLGVPLKRGRLFSDADSNGAPEVVILSESMAKRFWPNQDPLGQRLLWGRSQNPKTIVGIVGDLRDLSVDAEPQPTMFRPFAQLSDAPMTLLVRTRQDPVHAVPDIRRQIWTVDHNVALEFQTLPQTMSDSILRPRTALLSVAAFALVALITAAFGLYGLISYRVNQRQQEIGVRLALGATASTVLWSVQRRCLQLVCAGALIGLPAAFALSSLMASLLFETPATYLPAYLAVFMVFIAVALGASFGPALRAARLDPAAALRHD
jgi:putative ABC transport system permease protein